MTSTLRHAAPIGAALAAIALLMAPTAVASPDVTPGNTGEFLDELNLTNATLPGKTPVEMIKAGYAACQDLRNGASVLDEMSAVERAYAFTQGTLFVSAATTNLCPDFASG